MYELFSGIQNLLKLEDVRIDSNVFRLHYKATMILLVAFSIINTSTQYIGDPIDCIVESIPEHIIDTYCWISTTFTLPQKTGVVGVDVVHPGVGPYMEEQEPVKYHKYYQWVGFVLFFQAILFYVPRYMWKRWEGGILRNLVSGMKFVSLNREEMKTRCNILCDYLDKNMGNHSWYLRYFILCEFLNFINVIGQMFLMDIFLDGEFSMYGWEVLNFMNLEQHDRMDPMSRVFPKMSKCTFNMYGSSGTMNKIDALCLLPVNVINEKIYVVLWFWFLLLSVVTGLTLLYRTGQVLSLRLRCILLNRKSSVIHSSEIKYLCTKLGAGDWFILYQISHNIDARALKFLIKKLIKCIEFKNYKNLSDLTLCYNV